MPPGVCTFVYKSKHFLLVSLHCLINLFSWLLLETRQEIREWIHTGPWWVYDQTTPIAPGSGMANGYQMILCHPLLLHLWRWCVMWFVYENVFDNKKSVYLDISLVDPWNWIQLSIWNQTSNRHQIDGYISLALNINKPSRSFVVGVCWSYHWFQHEVGDSEGSAGHAHGQLWVHKPLRWPRGAEGKEAVPQEGAADDWWGGTGFGELRLRQERRLQNEEVSEWGSVGYTFDTAV